MAYSDLMALFPKPGKLVWIGLRRKKNGAMVSVDSVPICPDKGLDGDHYSGRSGKRQVTLIQFEHLAVIETLIGRTVSPEILRRNLLVSGINLLSLKNSSFQIGSAVLETTGLCHPCRKMEKALGAGGFNAMRGHGGLTARVKEAGTISVGDTVRPLAMMSSLRKSS